MKNLQPFNLLETIDIILKHHLSKFSFIEHLLKKCDYTYIISKNILILGSHLYDLAFQPFVYNTVTFINLTKA